VRLLRAIGLEGDGAIVRRAPSWPSDIPVGRPEPRFFSSGFCAACCGAVSVRPRDHDASNESKFTAPNSVSQVPAPITNIILVSWPGPGGLRLLLIRALFVGTVTGSAGPAKRPGARR
jgi:hypothetical protein